MAIILRFLCMFMLKSCRENVGRYESETCIFDTFPSVNGSYLKELCLKCMVLTGNTVRFIFNIVISLSRKTIHFKHGLL